MSCMHLKPSKPFSFLLLFGISKQLPAVGEFPLSFRIAWNWAYAHKLLRLFTRMMTYCVDELFVFGRIWLRGPSATKDNIIEIFLIMQMRVEQRMCQKFRIESRKQFDLICKHFMPLPRPASVSLCLCNLCAGFCNLYCWHTQCTDRYLNINHK